MFIKSLTLLLALTFIISCSEQIDIPKETEAIKSVIENETTSWFAEDYDKWASSWVHSDEILWMYSSKEGHGIFTTWEELAKSQKEYFENQDASDSEITRSGWVIKIYGNGAWATFIQHTNFKGEQDWMLDSRESRVLEKQEDGAWKIVQMAATNITSYEEVESKEEE